MKGKQILVGSIILTLTGLGLYLKAQYDLMMKLCYSVGGYRLIRLGVNETVAEVSLKITNNDALKANILGSSVKVYANGTHIADINESAQFHINPQKSVTVPLRVTIRPKQILSGLTQSGVGANIMKIKLRFKGYVRVRKLGIPIRVPFDFTYTIAELKGSSSDKTSC